MDWNRLTLSDIAACSGKIVTVDVETTGLHWWADHIIGVGLHCPDAKVSGYIPTLHEEERREVIEVINSWQPGTTFVAHNAKFEMHFLKVDPFKSRWNVWDTTDLIHIIDSRYPKGLDKAERIFLGTDRKKAFVAQAPMKLRKQIWNWSLDLVAPYCINDCLVEHELLETLIPIVEEMGLWKLFLKDMAYLKEIHSAERQGILLDTSFLQHALQSMEKDAQDLEKQLYDSVGFEFNWRSPQQLSRALYEGMGHPRPKNPYADADGVDRSKFADRGMYNATMTSTFILMEKAKHPLGELMSHLRESNLLIKTISKWMDLRDEEDIVHGSWNLTGTRTARLSSSEPNMQNIASEVRTRHLQSVYSGDAAIRTEDYNLRQAFVARPNHSFISTDYSQMEMRMFGLSSKDPFMLKSLAEGRDVHGDVAEKIWGTRDLAHREWAKTISFGLIYGMTVGSLMHRLNISAQAAKKVQDDYFKTFPSIRSWLFGTVAECKENGYIQYWSGRLWREESEGDMYKGANALIQGGCADLLSVVSIRLGKWLRANIPEAHIVNFVHDELIVECPDEAVREVTDKMQEIMSAPDLFDLPWKCSSKVGKTYGTMKDVSGAEY